MKMIIQALKVLAIQVQVIQRGLGRII